MHGVINLLIAHGHNLKLIIQILQRIHLSHPGFRILGYASNGAELRQMIKTYKPDVILADISLPGFPDIHELQKLTQSEQAKVIILWWHKDKLLMQEALAAGFPGYLVKYAGPEEYKEAVQKVKRGETFRCIETKKIAAQAPKGKAANIEHKKFSSVKYQLIAFGLLLKLSVRQLAVGAGVTYQTAKTYKQNLKKHLGSLSEASLEDYLEKVANAGE